MQEIAIDQAAATTAHHLSLAQKVRLESEELRRAAADRVDPVLATEFASNSAGIDLPTGRRLEGHLRGDMEQPSPADIDDAAAVGKEAEPFRMGAPNVDAGQRRIFQSARAASIANRIATGKTNARQLAEAVGESQGNQLTEEALRAPTNTIANKVIAAASGKPYMPFQTNASGTVLDRGEGVLDETPELAKRVRARIGAQAAQAAAAADASRARATYTRGPLTELTGARATLVKEGKPATPIAPQRVARMIDMSTQAEYKAEKAAWDALPLSKRNATPAPTMAAVRDRVAARFAQPDTQSEIAAANDAIARGADPAKVRARFRQRKGFDLPAQVAAAGGIASGRISTGDSTAEDGEE